MSQLDHSEHILNHHQMLELSRYAKKKRAGINNILIVGAGSIGALLGLALVKAGLNVTFAGRAQSKYTAQVKNKGLTVSYPSGQKFWISPSLPNVRFVDTQQELEEKFELIVVAVKSNCLASVTSYLHSHAGEDTILFHAQNGIPYWWFNDDNYLSSLNPTLTNKIIAYPHLNSVDAQGKIWQRLGTRCLVGGVIKAPCSKTAEGYIEVRKPPRMIVGLTNTKQDGAQEQKIKQLCHIFSAHGLETSYTSNIRTEVCNKLAVNVTTNILSALTGCLISELIANVHTNNLIKTILLEINQIFQVYGVKEADLPTEEKLYSYISQPGSQRHLPSLAQDFHHHRPGEVNLITAPVEMAQLADINIPTLSSLAKLIQLGQNYTLNSHKGQFYILGFSHARGFYLLQEEIESTLNPALLHLAAIFEQVIQINYSAQAQKTLLAA